MVFIGGGWQCKNRQAGDHHGGMRRIGHGVPVVAPDGRKSRERNGLRDEAIVDERTTHPGEDRAGSGPPD